MIGNRQRNPILSFRFLFRGFTLLAVLLTCMNLSACGVNPVTGERQVMIYSEDQEIAMGKNSYFPALQAQGGEWRLDEGLNRYVEAVGMRLAQVSDRPQLPYRFTVLNNSEPNAWALPGGKIAVNRGLLVELENEAELAAVLSHEIVHAAAQHGAQAAERGLLLQAGVLGVGLASANSRYAGLLEKSALFGASLINQRYSREQESEADFYGMQYMAKAGYDPAAAVTLQEKFVRLFNNENQNWLAGLFASHPPSEQRVEANRRTLSQLPVGGYIGEKEYAKATAFLMEKKEAYEDADKAESIAKEDPAKAMRLAEAARRILPKEAVIHALLGDLYADRQQYPAALASYDEAIRLNDGYYKFFLGRARVEKERGMVTKAAEDFKRSAELLPTAEAYLGLGRIAQGNRQENDAMAYFKKAAGSNSPAGQQAALEMQRIDLPKNPDKYITVKPVRFSGPPDALLVINNSSIPVRGLRLAVVFLLEGRQIAPTQDYAISQTLAAGGQTTIPFSLNLTSDQEDRLSISWAITSLSL